MSRIDHLLVDELVEWMIDGARPSASARDIVERICTQLTAAGVPIDRFALFIYTLHPNLVGWRFTWTPYQGVEVSQGKMGLFSTEEYTANPLPTVVEKQISIRRGLEDPDSPKDYRIVHELIADGFTDYLVQPVIYTTGETNAVSWSTKAAGGFGPEAVAVLERVNAPLARLTETYLLRLNAATILSAYVGRNGGDQILKGRVHRGDGEEIEGSILFTDIAGFTELSNAMSGPEVVSLINDTFDLMVPAIEGHGGEILKFLGDGFLAIFPHDASDLDAAAQAARASVIEAEAAIADAPVGERITFRSAIHDGRFHFGNIGGANRLDFTAIGRPVNYAARLLSAAGSLGLRRVASEVVAPHLGTPARLADRIAFKGFPGRQPVFTY
ncbi:adenylate/guanylate cyclase domain-containing protein [Arvimicrobium flavum]|uniref:adenylate/guanylate cyclase domain-containing protein n=1 Tax=Arvimicrobium flavum TaxID=3393320 RepID=UPI00237AD150|nr:adenylate/guanylate cyclase domain-containing protein [Mesorhizobium shangrilense]